MSTSLKQARKLPFFKALQWMSEKVNDAESLLGEADTNQLQRATVPIEPLDLIGWLSNQSVSQQMYWSDRKKTFEVVALGALRSWQGRSSQFEADHLSEIEQTLSEAERSVKIFGGRSFHAYDCESDWSSYQSYYFVLPQLEIFRKDEDYYLALNFSNDDAQKAAELLAEINAQTQFRRRQISQLLSRSDFPDKQTFVPNVAEVLRQIEQGEITKIVLARKTTFKFENPLEKVDIFHRLLEQAPNCFHFFLQPDATNVFLGASPERLYRREGSQLKTEALAGTRSRGLSKEHDNLLKKELLESQKDRLEHDIVITDISDSLKPLCSAVDREENRSLVSLKGGHHLVTRIQAELLPSVSDFDILAALHPTAAVAGSPTDKAIELISELEPFSRGFYAGPVGYFGKNESEFSVAIRSGMIKDNSVSLFSGAGIVAESDPISEWEEIENKMNAFLKVLND